MSIQRWWRKMGGIKRREQTVMGRTPTENGRTGEIDKESMEIKMRGSVKILKGQGWTVKKGIKWQRIVTDGDDWSRGWNNLNDVTPIPQGTKGGGEGACIHAFQTHTGFTHPATPHVYLVWDLWSQLSECIDVISVQYGTHDIEGTVCAINQLLVVQVCSTQSNSKII